MTPLNENQLRGQFNEEVQELHRQLREKDTVFENYKKNRGGLEVFFRQVKDSISPITPLPNIYSQRKSDKKSKIFAVMQVSDSHMGSVQHSDEVEGFNSFDPKICENRNLGFVKVANKHVMTMRNSYLIDELHVIYTGDLISGDIHDELRVTNAFPVPVQVVEAAKVHAKQIALLAPNYEKVVVHFLVEDNHSRLTKKPQANEAAYNSMNYLVGMMFKSYVEKHTNVEFNLYPMFEKVINIGGTQYLIKHGHGIKSWMGVPWYGIERNVGKESTSRFNSIMNDIELIKEIGFHKIIHGHFHVDFNSPLFACAASVQGTTAYDHQAGRYSEPGQPLWFIHHKHGEFSRTNFKLKQFDNGF